MRSATGRRPRARVRRAAARRGRASKRHRKIASPGAGACGRTRPCARAQQVTTRATEREPKFVPRKPRRGASRFVARGVHCSRDYCDRDSKLWMPGLLESVSQALVSVGRLCKAGTQPEREPDQDELTVLREISAAVQQPYDMMLHEADLRAIHQAFYGIDKPFAAVSADWRLAGFQGNDPTTDLRGAGSLGLKQLAYFVTKYPDRSVAVRMRRLNSKACPSTAADVYPWAAVGINVTRAVCELFHVLSPYGAPGGFACTRCSYWSVLRDEDFVNELYCAMFEYVDAQHSTRGLGYMDFPMLLDEAKDTVRTELAKCCDSHAVSIHCLGGYYSSRLPLETVRLGLGLPSVLSATRRVADPAVTDLQIQHEGDVSCRSGRGCTGAYGRLPGGSALDAIDDVLRQSNDESLSRLSVRVRGLKELSAEIGSAVCGDVQLLRESEHDFDQVGHRLGQARTQLAGGAF